MLLSFQWTKYYCHRSTSNWASWKVFSSTCRDRIRMRRHIWKRYSIQESHWQNWQKVNWFIGALKWQIVICIHRCTKWARYRAINERWRFSRRALRRRSNCLGRFGSRLIRFSEHTSQSWLRSFGSKYVGCIQGHQCEHFTENPLLEQPPRLLCPTIADWIWRARRKISPSMQAVLEKLQRKKPSFTGHGFVLESDRWRHWITTKLLKTYDLFCIDSESQEIHFKYISIYI